MITITINGVEVTMPAKAEVTMPAKARIAVTGYVMQGVIEIDAR